MIRFLLPDFLNKHYRKMVVMTRGRGNIKLQSIAVSFRVFRNSIHVQKQLSAAFTGFSDGSFFTQS